MQRPSNVVLALLLVFADAAVPARAQYLTMLRLRPTRCISWRGWCKWTPVEPAGTCPGYKSSKLDGSEDPWTTGARDERTAIGGGSLA